MSLNVQEIYEDVLDRINEPENGQLTTDRFNRYSWIAQLSLIDWLSGSLDGKTPPEPYQSQKDKDWLSPFITKYPKQVENGKIIKPSDYYGYENFYVLGTFNEVNSCYDVIENNGVKCNTPIELLDGSKYTQRCITYIEGLQPSFKKPISKLVGSYIELNPQDLGNVTLEYIRYPKRAYLGTKLDPVYNEEVYDAATSVDFEWGDYARSLLVWYIADFYFDWTRERSGKELNLSSKPVNS